MAPQPFAFPPPPPPPPSSASASTSALSYNGFYQSTGRGLDARGRGGLGRGGDRGSFRGSFRGRGRGSERGRGSSFSSNSHHRGGPHTYIPRGNPHNAAQNTAKRPSAPKQAPSPAIPAFGAPLPTLSSPLATFKATSAASPPSVADSRTTSPKKSRKRKRKHNQLGLTPAGADYDSSSSDAASGVDEEAKLAAQATQTVLQFEYKGTTATLRTPEEIAAWIAQRRARWPTAAKVEAHKEEQARRKAERDKVREAAFEARRKIQEERKTRLQDDSAKGKGKGKGKQNARELKRSQSPSIKKMKIEEQSAELARAEAALEVMRARLLRQRRDAADESNTAGDISSAVKAEDPDDDDSSVLDESSSEESSIVSSTSEDEDEDEDEATSAESDEEEELQEDDASSLVAIKLEPPSPSRSDSGAPIKAEVGFANEDDNDEEDDISAITNIKVEQPSPRKAAYSPSVPAKDGREGENEDDDEDDDEAPPDELARGSQAALVRMPPSRSQSGSHDASSKSASNVNAKNSNRPYRPPPEPCRLWTHVGRCPLRDAGCRGSHPHKARGSQMQSMTLRARLEERDRENEAEQILAAIRELGDGGFFAAPGGADGETN